MELVKQWSALKKTILNSPHIRHQPVQEGFDDVFKLFDQKLSKKLKEVEAAAEKSAKREDEASRDDYLDALNQALKAVVDYQKLFHTVSKGWAKKYPSSGGSWAYIDKALTKIEADVLKTRQLLLRGA